MDSMIVGGDPNQQGAKMDDRSEATTTPSDSNESEGGHQYVSPLKQISKPYFPSAASLDGSMFSSDYSSEMSEGSDEYSEYSSDEYSDEDSDDDEEDDELNFEHLMPRRPPPTPAGVAARPAPTPPIPIPMPFPMPAMPASEGLPFGGVEGLPFTLESLKRDLEKVGRAIIQSNAGEVAAERAQTLASINWLASHVPNAVLDKLGHEIKNTLSEDDAHNELSKTGDDSFGIENKVTSIMSDDDEMSEVSDLSNHEDEPSYEDEETLKMVEPAEVPNVQISYGDLATFAYNQASSYLPEDDLRPCVKGGGLLPEIDEVNPARSPLNNVPNLSLVSTATGTMGSILDSLPMRRSSDGSFRDQPVMGSFNGGVMPVNTRRSSTSTVTTATSTASTKGSQKKGVKGLFRRLKKGPKGDIEPNAIINPLNVPGMPPKHPGTLGVQKGSGARAGEIESTKEVSKPFSTSLVPQQQVVDSRKLPYASKYRCALLFVDISGFTKLSRLLDPESLSKAINTYFQLIVDEVLDGKGDLLKFAGDAVFIEWKAGKDCNLETCVESAVECAAKIISRCSDFSVLSNGESGNSSYLVTSQAAHVDTLNVHCGIGAGQMVGVHVGDHSSRREYLLLGQPISQATVATDFASFGEVAISPEAHAIVSRLCDFRKDALSDGKTPIIVATRDEFRYSSKRTLGTHAPRKIVNSISRGVTSHVEGLEVDALRKYRRMMSLYVHPVVVDNDLAAADNFKTKKAKKVDKTAQERHREEAEIRNVFTMFVNPKVETKVTDNEAENQAMYETLNDIMNLSSREIERFKGHLRQFIVDDKGLVMIITFGLRGTTIPNMVSQRALPATIAIHNSLKLELGIDSRIGATIGEAYCGVVGGVKRHEYAVLGPSVNLAARLMASKINPGILVDNRVRMMANRSYAFNALPPVVAKGYNEPVPIFEPLSTLERYWGRVVANFVGRKSEIKTIMQFSSDMLRSQSPCRFVLLEGKSGMGKSTVIAHSIEHVRRSFSPKKNRLVVIKNVSKESDSLVPFGVFRSILGKVLASFQKGINSDERSLKSGGSLSTHGLRSIAWESLSGRSVSQSTQNLTAEDSIAIFNRICQELNMTPAFVDYALSELLGVELAQACHGAQSTPPSMEEMVSFLSQAFRLCTRDSKLVILALDDIHHADEYSWKVIQQLYLTEKNILFVGTVNTSSVNDLRVDPGFWEELDGTLRARNRFTTMKLGHLNREEVTLMIMKTLGLRRKDVPDDVLDGVTIQSGGMPHFVNEILENVKRQMAADDDFELADMTFDSFGDLILQRLDSFDLNTRNILNIGAVIGLSFTLNELVAAELRTTDACEAVVRKITEEALQVAIEDGILESREMDDDDSEEEEGTRYAFCHDVWRSTLLNLMLEGRKRDLHRIIAETLEKADVESNDYMFQTKLFKHWVNSGNLSKSTELALTVGQHFEERLGLPAQSIRIYTETLDLLRESEDGYSKGFSPDIIAKLTTEDLTCIIRVQVALAKALTMALQMKESVSAYQDALKITQIAKCSSQMKDRSILFPVFDGLASAVKNGYIKQDTECRYEKAMLRRYMQETRLHGDPIYIIHALTLQANMYARLGDFEKAIEVQKTLSQIYTVEYFSADLCDLYGSDIGAQCLASSALWHLQLEMTEEALSIARFVTSEILPQIERRNIHATFMVIYPILFVFAECGCAAEARENFETFVCEPFTELPQGMSTFFFPLYDPILMFLDLRDSDDIEQAILEDYIEWAGEIDNLNCGEAINSRTAEMDRSGDSISAEICYLLAQRVESKVHRDMLIAHGKEIAACDTEFVQDKGTFLTKQCSANLHANFEQMERENA